jgi:flagellar motor switch protein FliN/FliY
LNPPFTNDQTTTMSSELEKQDTPPESTDASSETKENPGGDVEIGSPDFQEMAGGPSGGSASADLNRFQDIKVNVSADLGRAEVPIQTLMNIGEGSVLELNRSIDSPVELVAQGVPLACGEVVVVNGCFAIRVTKVYETHKG